MFRLLHEHEGFLVAFAALKADDPAPELHYQTLTASDLRARMASLSTGDR